MIASTFEMNVVRAVGAIVREISPDLRSRGIALGSLELVESPDERGGNTELRIYAYRAGQLCDVLEVRGREPTTSLGEIEAWLRDQLPTSGSSRNAAR